MLTWQRPGRRLAAAIGPTLKGDQTTAIVISMVYRSCTIPVAWRIHRTTQRGSWMDPTVELLKELAPAVPRLAIELWLQVPPDHPQPTPA